MTTRYRACWPVTTGAKGHETITMIGDVVEFDSPEEGLRQLRIAASSPRISPHLLRALACGTVEFVPIASE